MIELSDIKDEIIKTWNAAKKESALEFRAICTKYTGDTNIDQHIQETIVGLKDYRDNGGLGNLYINTDPKPDFFDDSQTAIYHIGILSDDNLNLIANYYYEYLKKWFKELFESDNKKTIKDLIYRCCYGFFVKIQTVKRLLDLQDKVKERYIKPQHNKPEQLPNVLGNDKTKELYKKLMEDGFISNTSQEHFLYWFGCSMDVPNELSPIQWTTKRGYKVLLSYLIANIYTDEFPNKQACIAFGENSLKQLQFQYSGNTKDDGKPKKHLLIDNILKDL